MLFAVAVVFIPLGAVCLGASNSVDEVRRRYDDDPACYRGFFPTDAEANRRRSDAGAGVTCELTITPRRTLKAPVYVYYELQNVLQNHRRFVKSRSDDQAAGRPRARRHVLRTQGVRSQLHRRHQTRGEPVRADGVVDVQRHVRVRGGRRRSRSTPPVPSIAWRSDVEEKFADYAPANVNDDPSTRGGRAIGPSVSRDERFIVWMRTAALPKFRKLWGRIERDSRPAGATVRQFASTTRGTRTPSEGRKRWMQVDDVVLMGGKNAFWARRTWRWGVVRAGERAVPVLPLQAPEKGRGHVGAVLAKGERGERAGQRAH